MALALTALGIILGLYYIAFLGAGGGVDGRAYFLADPFSPYVHGFRLLGEDAYLYSPAFAQAISPLRWLGWPAFIVSLRLLELASLAYLAGPLTPIVLFWSPVTSEINAANIHLLMAAAAVFGFRKSGVWAFILLTKLTPGVCLLWFVVRRDWQALRSIALVTVAIVAVSAILSPLAWLDWFAALGYNATHQVQLGALTPTTISPVWRIMLAGALVVVAASRGWTWGIPVCLALSLPAVWYHALSILTAVPRRALLDWNRSRRRAGLPQPPEVNTPTSD